MIRRSLRIGVIVCAALWAVAARAASPEFEAFLAGVRADALAQGISAATVDRALTGLEPIERVLQRDRAQAEFTLTLDTYMSRVVTPANIERGRTLAQRHRDVLARVAAQYGVQPRFILAIWGMETRYGAVETSIPVMAAVATLAFDPRRSTYFRNQLMAALRMVDRGYIDLVTMTGSWAGAMGQVQFMPDSYLNFAVDFDGDGKRDIWNSIPDVFGSIANYLAKSGWRDDQTWGRRVTLPGNLNLDALRDPEAKGCRAARDMTAMKPLPEWQNLGVRRADGGALPERPLPASIVKLPESGGMSFAVYTNYKSILAYNCAHLYAITVGTLADRIGEG
jgi:membrane-bound lytic murein transglycosylase B